VVGAEAASAPGAGAAFVVGAGAAFVVGREQLKSVPFAGQLTGASSV
jgi:hypothetical protein